MHFFANEWLSKNFNNLIANKRAAKSERTRTKAKFYNTIQTQANQKGLTSSSKHEFEAVLSAVNQHEIELRGHFSTVQSVRKARGLSDRTSKKFKLFIHYSLFQIPSKTNNWSTRNLLPIAYTESFFMKISLIDRGWQWPSRESSL